MYSSMPIQQPSFGPAPLSPQFLYHIMTSAAGRLCRHRIRSVSNLQLGAHQMSFTSVCTSKPGNPLVGSKGGASARHRPWPALGSGGGILVSTQTTQRRQVEGQESRV
jgi:hypothetical protein